MFKKIAFTMYPVKDMARARNFYEHILGLEVGKIFSHDEQAHWVEYDLPQGGCLALTNMAEGVQPSDHAGGSVAFEVEDLDALVEQLKDREVKIKLDIFATPVCRIAVIVDSEGNAITLHQLKK